MILKILPYFIVLALGITAGGFGGSRIAINAAQASVVPCNCNCPPAAQVDLGNLDFGKINNRKGTLEIKLDQKFDHITVVVDSATYVKILNAAKAKTP